MNSTLQFVDGAVKWSQDGDRLWLDVPFGRYHLDMPFGWSLSATHPDLVRVASQLLVGPWVKGILGDWTPSRRPGTRPGLAYSSGTDSTVAMLLMPETTALAYLEREFSSFLRHDNALRMFRHLEDRRGRSVIRVPTDLELIRTHVGLPPGFTHDLTVLVHLLLLGDMLDLDSVAAGMKMQTAYFDRGRRWREFADSPVYRAMSPRLASIGLDLYLPLAGCPDPLIFQIIRAEALETWALGCIRGTDARTCGECKKCFRLDLRMGRKPNLSPEAMHLLYTPPVRHAVTVLYELQQARRSGVLPRKLRRHPLLVRWGDLDLGFLEHYYPPAIDLIPQQHREFTRSRLDHYATPMSEPYRAREVDLYPEGD